MINITSIFILLITIFYIKDIKDIGKQIRLFWVLIICLSLIFGFILK